MAEIYKSIFSMEFKCSETLLHNRSVMVVSFRIRSSVTTHFSSHKLEFSPNSIVYHWYRNLFWMFQHLFHNLKLENRAYRVLIGLWFESRVISFLSLLVDRLNVFHHRLTKTKKWKVWPMIFFSKYLTSKIISRFSEKFSCIL